MATISKAITENTVRTAAFAALNMADNTQFVRISNQSYGAVFTDDNGMERMVEIKAIVRSIKTMEDREMSASEMLEFEAQEYANDVAKKAENKKKNEAKKAEKIAKDAEKRAAAKAKKEKKEAEIE